MLPIILVEWALFIIMFCGCAWGICRITGNLSRHFFIGAAAGVLIAPQPIYEYGDFVCTSGYLLLFALLNPGSPLNVLSLAGKFSIALTAFFAASLSFCLAPTNQPPSGSNIISKDS